MKIYDTLMGSKRNFAPSGDVVSMYVCGVTPYASAHVGHAMSYIMFDVIRRYLEFIGFSVRHVQNFTDVDDKIIDRASREGIEVTDLAEKFITDYFEDMTALNVQNAHVYPRASEEIGKMIEIIEAMVRSGVAYEVEGDVYFRVKEGQSYGKLSHRTLESMRAGARVETSERKEHPMDFALWKAAKPKEPKWESPWGPGRPGWHIECSAMALKYLDAPVDIHGGGQDLVFPHHENEIAQSETVLLDKPFVNFWLHNGLLHMDQEKMSKSLGNLVTIKQVLTEYSADAVRLFFLGSHYRSPIAYSEEALKAAERGVARLKQASLAKTPGGGEFIDTAEHRERFFRAMEDDFNTPQAVASLFDLAREVNRGLKQDQNVSEAQEFLREIGRKVLGFTFDSPISGMTAEVKTAIQQLVDQRIELRHKRNFAEADAIRAKLQGMNVTLADGPDSTEWFLGPG